MRTPSCAKNSASHSANTSVSMRSESVCTVVMRELNKGRAVLRAVRMSTDFFTWTRVVFEPGLARIEHLEHRAPYGGVRTSGCGARQLWTLPQMPRMTPRTTTAGAHLLPTDSHPP